MTNRRGWELLWAGKRQSKASMVRQIDDMAELEGFADGLREYGRDVPGPLLQDIAHRRVDLIRKGGRIFDKPAPLIDHAKA